MSQTIVIFGASGDLTSRKLIPALYQLERKKRLDKPCRIVGVSRTPTSDAEWREKLRNTTQEFVGESFDPHCWDAFATTLHYFAGDVEKQETFPKLNAALQSLENGEPSNRLYYLSISPVFYAATVKQLGDAGMADESHGAQRVIIEKPFGTDLETARRLNNDVHRVFLERQVYRIDHYLGKETVNNLLVLRFANAIFEPIWNRNYIDHVQITANEEVLVGRRAPFYEKAGILRDMFQNHLLQLLTFAAMEPPARFDADAVRDEKVKVLHAIRGMSPDEVAVNTLRGQYRSYRDESGVAPNSRTATYAAVRLMIDNWRWKDVPFYLRSGKGMSCRTTQIIVQFRRPPHLMFAKNGGASDGIYQTPEIDANRMLIQIQPAEGIQIHFLTKVPDTDMQMRQTEFQFHFRESFRGELPEAYERLLLDAMHGDASLFARSDEVEAAWRIIDPIQSAWDNSLQSDTDFYEVNAWGPPAASDWIRRFGCEWFDSCPLLNHANS
ncbi:MAG: glucose-6-phosphate dehydrogenase [Planctomycetaceae bacterium]|jgi:glucose-6-phosphate 1-dehydrogenase|nr:glucose-6-phosphate dehydrogenase [Planctomycetaceae bacterium]